MDAADLAVGKNDQWLACYKAELKRQDALLNAACRKVQAAAAPVSWALLVKGQQAWLAYREAWCRFEETSPTAPGGAVFDAACQMEPTIAQVARLTDSGE